MQISFEETISIAKHSLICKLLLILLSPALEGDFVQQKMFFDNLQWTSKTTGSDCIVFWPDGP